MHFYRTQVSLGSDLWVRLSVTKPPFERLCFIVQAQAHLAIPCSRSPKVAAIKQDFTSFLENIYCWSLWSIHKSGYLDKKLGWGLWRPGIQRLSWWRFQRATFQKLQNEQDIDIFLTRYSLVWTLQIYKEPKGPEMLRRTHESKDDGTQRERICLWGNIPITLSLGNVTHILNIYFETILH